MEDPKRSLWSSIFDDVWDYSGVWNKCGRSGWTSTKDYSLAVASHYKDQLKNSITLRSTLYCHFKLHQNE